MRSGLIALLAAQAGAPSTPLVEARAAAPVFAAYVPDYRLEHFSAADAEGLTDVLFFSVRPDARGAVEDPGRLLERLDAALPRARSFRALLSVGGGARSAGFAATAADPARRARLIATLLALLERHHLDGLDLDWEHHRGPADHLALATLLVELRQALGPRGFLLTVAVGDATALTAEAIGAVDRIHLMAYDGPRHGTLALATDRVERALRHGVPAEKLCLGIPLFAVGRGRAAASPWRDVSTRHRPAPAVDALAGWRFNGVDTTRAKARWAREQQLGGVFFWELTQDARGASSLINAAQEELRASAPR